MIDRDFEVELYLFLIGVIHARRGWPCRAMQSGFNRAKGAALGYDTLSQW